MSLIAPHPGRTGEKMPRAYGAFSHQFDVVIRPDEYDRVAIPEEEASVRERLGNSHIVDLARLRAQIDHYAGANEAFKQISDGLDAGLSEAIARGGLAPQDMAVTLLLDNSNSLRGRPIMGVALWADLLVAKLETLGVATEILGNTTRGWNGDPLYLAWGEDGKPPSPGRLRALMHVVYKDFSETFHKAAKTGLGLMLREGFLKESTHGEALRWAAGRLQARPEKRRLLIQIGNLCADETVSQKHNRSDLISRDYEDSIREITAQGQAKLAAIALLKQPTEVPAPFAHCAVVGDYGTGINDLLSPYAAGQRVAALFAAPHP